VTRHAPLERSPACSDAGDQMAQLRRALGLVEQIAGRTPAPAGDSPLDEAARIGAAHADALPIVQRRFDRLAAGTILSTAAGMKALLVLQDRGRPAQAAACRLADELERALDRLGLILSI
jgi:hypothetical protein